MVVRPVGCAEGRGRRRMSVVHGIWKAPVCSVHRATLFLFADQPAYRAAQAEREGADTLAVAGSLSFVTGFRACARHPADGFSTAGLKPTAAAGTIASRPLSRSRRSLSGSHAVNGRTPRRARKRAGMRLGRAIAFCAPELRILVKRRRHGVAWQTSPGAPPEGSRCRLACPGETTIGGSAFRACPQPGRKSRGRRHHAAAPPAPIVRSGAKT